MVSVKNCYGHSLTQRGCLRSSCTFHFRVRTRYMSKKCQRRSRTRALGVTHMIFGDLFLADVRAYRERHLAGSGITPVFPVWGRQTAALAREMIGSGLEAHLSTVDLKRLPGSFAGRKFDGSLLAALPAGVDPCGENGEFHSFVSAGPMFSRDLTIRVGETIERDGFAYADLLLA